MSKDYSEVISKMSDFDLNRYLTDYLKYDTDAVECAFREFDKRGIPLDSAQTQKIRSALSDRDVKRNEQYKIISDAKPGWLENNIVDDPLAPELYSEKAIVLISFFITPIVGAVLLAMNIKSLNRPKGVLSVVNFGFLITGISSFVVYDNFYLINLAIINVIACVFFQKLFWDKYIGRELKYRTKSVGVAIIVGLFLNIVSLIVMKNLE